MPWQSNCWYHSCWIQTTTTCLRHPCFYCLCQSLDFTDSTNDSTSKKSPRKVCFTQIQSAAWIEICTFRRQQKAENCKVSHFWHKDDNKHRNPCNIFATILQLTLSSSIGACFSFHSRRLWRTWHWFVEILSIIAS